FITHRTKKINEKACEAFTLACSSRVSAGARPMVFDFPFGSGANSSRTGRRNYGKEVRVFKLTSSREERYQSSTQNHSHRPRSWFQNRHGFRWRSTKWRRWANFQFGPGVLATQEGRNGHD